ncbi:GNAT family N-acetyltransferase [Haladaptatus sp. DYF46]|uniref:GNAT family N-acetyltransferase n=1 Tax=Haladaptatus sp. DYF46 TaxID=2886041 RepID=UPI001E48F5E5|nr:GNAT family N-acetyltransferase [Haladaptatus sp. DYF46]
MRIRRLRGSELVRFVDELWLPFAREMAAMDDFDTLADSGVRENVFSYVKDRFSDDDIATFVAEEDGLVGYVSVEKRSSPPVFARGPRGYIDGLFVCVDHRQEGVASALLSRAEAWARRLECEFVSLDVHADNHVARSLYRRADYVTKRYRMTKRL